MNPFIIFMGSFFALLASVVIAHVSMVAAMGPWIAPIIVIISGVFARLRFAGHNKEQMHQELALIQTVGSVGGIVAMAIGFTLPMLYFLQPEAFNEWMANPGYFSALACLIKKPLSSNP